MGAGGAVAPFRALGCRRATVLRPYFAETPAANPSAYAHPRPGSGRAPPHVSAHQKLPRPARRGVSRPHAAHGADWAERQRQIHGAGRAGFSGGSGAGESGGGVGEAESVCGDADAGE